MNLVSYETEMIPGSKNKTKARSYSS